MDNNLTTSGSFNLEAFISQAASNGTLQLYVGNLREWHIKEGFVGLSPWPACPQELLHDITAPLPFPDECCHIAQSEDVFEHIPKEQITDIINEFYRVLIPGGCLRISVPDYRCDLLKDRCLYYNNGQIAFDPDGGGCFKNGQVEMMGHLWFPTIEDMREIITLTKFERNKVQYLHYHDENYHSILKPINYDIGHVLRTPDNDERVQNPRRAMSIVVDLHK